MSEADCPQLGETVQLRINPLRGTRLSTKRMRDTLSELAEIWKCLDKLTQPACDELYELIKNATGSERGRLLTLKRDIYNNRMPQSVASSHPLPLITGQWVATRQSYEAAAKAVSRVVPEERAAERATLRILLSSGEFQRSLALVAPNVFEAAQRYTDHGSTGIKRNDRKSERGLLQYLTRAMVRTSPLSQFTAVGLFTVEPNGVAMHNPILLLKGLRSYVSVDRALFSYICGGLVPDDGTRSLRLHPTATIANNQLTYFHPVGGHVQQLAIKLTEVMHVILSQTELGARDIDELTEVMAERLGMSWGQTAAVVASAVRAGLLIADSPINDQASDIVAEALAELPATEPVVTRLLNDLQKQLAVITRGSAHERSTALKTTRDIENELTVISNRPARIHVNEDLCLPPGSVDLSASSAALQDLGDMLEMREVFDRQHDIRAILTTAFCDLVGPGNDASLVDIARPLTTIVYRRESLLTEDTAIELGPRDGSLKQLLGVRSELLNRVTQEIRKETPSPVVILDPKQYQQFRLPERFKRNPASYGVLVQNLGKHELVVNDIYPGHGMTYARFLGHDKELGGKAADINRARLHALYGPHLREDYGLHDSNINHRIRLLDTSLTPRDWARLRIRHDPVTDDLCLIDTDDTMITVLPLGMKWPETLPEPLRIASWLADTGRLVTDFTDSVHRSFSASQVTTPYPRVVFGSVVMHRRRWYYGLDAPLQAEALIERLQRWTEWRARHSVPEQVVAKTPISEQDMSELSDHNGRFSYMQRRRREKPQYLDFASVTVLEALPKFLQRRGTTYFEEALPEVIDGKNAFEWVVEFDRPAYGTFKREHHG